MGAALGSRGAQGQASPWTAQGASFSARTCDRWGGRPGEADQGGWRVTEAGRPHKRRLGCSFSAPEAHVLPVTPASGCRPGPPGKCRWVPSTWSDGARRPGPWGQQPSQQAAQARAQGVSQQQGSLSWTGSVWTPRRWVTLTTSSHPNPRIHCGPLPPHTSLETMMRCPLSPSLQVQHHNTQRTR